MAEIKPEQVPDKVWSAFHEAVLRYGYKPQALAAAINAWPGMLADGDLVPGENGPPLHLVNAIILPLPENPNGNG